MANNFISNWYCVRTNTRRESVAAQSLRSYGIEVLAPLVLTEQITPYRRNEVIAPLFPSYIFAKLNLSHFYSLRAVHGVHSLVLQGSSPAELDEQIIAGIRSRVGSDGFVRLKTEADPHTGLVPNEPVEIVSGVWAGFVGVFDPELHSSDRVRILLSAIYQTNAPVKLDLPRAHVVPLRAA